jgi:hypothetical protein
MTGNAATDARAMLHRARYLFLIHKMDEAAALAHQAAGMTTTWGLLEDSPRKLLDDIQKTRARADQEQAAQLMTRARVAFDKGQYDEAEKLAYQAERLHGPYRLFETVDRPQTLLAQIEAARNKANKPAITPATLAAAAPGRNDNGNLRKKSDTPPTATAAKGLPKAPPSPNDSVTTVAASKDQPSPVASSKDQPSPVASSKDQPSPVASSKDQSSPVASSKDQPSPVASSKDQPSPVGPSKDQPSTTKDQPSTVATSKDQPVAVKETTSPADKDQPTATTAKEQPAAGTTPAKNQPAAARSRWNAPLMPLVFGPQPPAKPAASTVVSTDTAKTNGVRPTAAEAPAVGTSQVVPAYGVVAQAGPRTSAEPTTVGTSEFSVVGSAPVPAPAPVPPPPAPKAGATAVAAPTAQAHMGCVDDNCCGDDFAGLTLAGHVGFMIAHPYWKSNPAFTASTLATTTVGRQIEFGEGAQFVPELSIGVVGCNDWGFRTNWWGFATSDPQTLAGTGLFKATATPLGLGIPTAAPTALFLARAQLGMNVWDFEGTQDWFTGPWALQVAAGLRYAHLDQRYDVLEAPTPALTTVNVLKSGHNFNGIGPTLFFRARRQLGCTGAYVFTSARGSLLFGRVHQDADATFNLLDPVDLSTNSRMVMPVAELELGGGWRYLWSGIDIFVEGALTNQVWFEAGNASRSTVSLADEGLGITADYNLGIIAFSLRAGINY